MNFDSTQPIGGSTTGLPFSQPATVAPVPCPACGYCPTCGRVNHQPAFPQTTWQGRYTVNCDSKK